MGMGGWEMVIVVIAILLLFGAKKIPELAKGLGTGIKEFKKATRDVTEEMHSAMEDTPPPPKPLPAVSTPTEPQQTVPQSNPATKA